MNVIFAVIVIGTAVNSQIIKNSIEKISETTASLN